jgi:hypothetical protein
LADEPASVEVEVELPLPSLDAGVAVLLPPPTLPDDDERESVL